MKKLIVIIAALCLAMPFITSADETTKYVKANGKVYFCNSIKAGMSNLLITTTTGEKLKIPHNLVEEYMTDEVRYDRLPLDNTANSIKVMMKYVTQKGGLRLYEMKDKEAYSDYFRVYKDGKLHLIVTQLNAEEILPFFGIKYLHK